MKCWPMSMTAATPAPQWTPLSAPVSAPLPPWTPPPLPLWTQAPLPGPPLILRGPEFPVIVNIDICSWWRLWPLPLLGLLLIPEVFHVIPRHPWRSIRDVPQDDHRPPLLDVLRPDAVGHLVSGVTIHAQHVTSLDGNLGNGRADSDWLEVKLKKQAQIKATVGKV